VPPGGQVTEQRLKTRSLKHVAPSIREKIIFLHGCLADDKGKHTLFRRPYKYILRITFAQAED
jgi:hypothetical protein